MASVVYIKSLEDPRLSDYVSLTDVALRKTLEPQQGLYIAESPKVISRSLTAGHQPRSVLLQQHWLADMEELLVHYDCPIFVGTADVLENLTGFHMHRGALASMFRPQLMDVETLIKDATTVVVLEDIVDHTNVGAIFRTVAGLGADAVIISPQCADPLYRRSVRVSMGTVLQIPWTRMLSWEDTTTMLRKYGFHISAFALETQSVSLHDFTVAVPPKNALIFGAEGDGLSAKALGLADTVVNIPMKHGVDSLNVAAASAVALYAVLNK